MHSSSRNMAAVEVAAAEERVEVEDTVAAVGAPAVAGELKEALAPEAEGVKAEEAEPGAARERAEARERVEVRERAAQEQVEAAVAVAGAPHRSGARMETTTTIQ